MRCGIALACLLLASPAFGHSWYTGQQNAEGQSCCNTVDCQPIPPETVRCFADRCEITLAPGQHGEAPDGGRFVFFGQPGSSPDHMSHACIYWKGKEQGKTPAGFDGVARCMWFGGGS